MIGLLLSAEHAALLLTRGFRALSAFLCVTTALKLLVELSMFRHLRKRSHSTLKRSAILMTGGGGGGGGGAEGRDGLALRLRGARRDRPAGAQPLLGAEQRREL